MSPKCYIAVTHVASGPRGPDLAHMHHVYRPYTALITSCIGQYEVSTHATCQLHVTCLGTHGASGPRGPDLAHMHLIHRPYTALITPCIGQYGLVHMPHVS